MDVKVKQSLVLESPEKGVSVHVLGPLLQLAILSQELQDVLLHIKVLLNQLRTTCKKQYRHHTDKEKQFKKKK